jgi:hypothetical protein
LHPVPPALDFLLPVLLPVLPGATGQERQDDDKNWKTQVHQAERS